MAQVAGLMPALTKRTLPSPRQTLIPAVCPDWARAESQPLFHMGCTWNFRHWE